MENIESRELFWGRVITVFKQAFKVNKNPFPWLKAFRAGLAASLPVFIGMLLGHLDYGLLACIGAFTYLYVFDIPYVQRAKKIFFVMIGITLSVFLGTLLAPYPIGADIVMGVIGAIAIFVFGALQITGPSAIFFVLCFAMTTGMPSDPSLAPLRAGFVLLGGALSWVISMLGWFKNPHGPEINAVKRVYKELASLMDAVGTSQLHAAKNRMISALNQTESVLLSGYSTKVKANGWKRLYLLNEYANAIYIDVVAYSNGKNSAFPPELGASVRALSESIGSKKKNDRKILQPVHMNKEVGEILEKIYDADAILNENVDKIDQEVQVDRPSLKTIFLGAFDKKSIIFLSSIKYGVVLTIAALIAHIFPFERSYWVPLSCAAVMSGNTIIATFHRAVQRMFGTLIGLLIAGLILVTVHNGYIIALVILCLTFVTELFIVRNYGMAALFFTPSALIMAEYSTQVFDYSYFATVRATDIIVGSLIGLAGALLIGSRSASKLLNHLIAKTIRSQGQLILAMFSRHSHRTHYTKISERSKMQTNFTNLMTLYNTALGELFSNKERIDSLWPVIFSIEQIEHYLDTSLKTGNSGKIPDETLAQWLYVFETMALAVDNDQIPTVKEVPDIEGFTHLRTEVLELQKAFQLVKKEKPEA
ncbi:putative membrane protein YccC [Pullulanibacillus pueri]|uniref:Putative membrane protein YvaC n=1 Tax=Pullulanibacillus pueri TaxID=1437324 RepID=A0A8J2ZW13_9BACL|nr:FUSC family protein [Pullulanibacillus pueri]MBM7682231.1 putative membrane protein YccC [Pullulanibacillus pueri]GGH80541.1 putative membrane protein YvaC [Pullulanibacillus pueri]